VKTNRNPPPPVFEDECFFADHPDRKIHIRRPTDPLEFITEFRSLGPHEYDRRRVIIARVAFDVARRFRREFLTIPFLAFADEEIADRDDIPPADFGRHHADRAGAVSMRPAYFVVQRFFGHAHPVIYWDELPRQPLRHLEYIVRLDQFPNGELLVETTLDQLMRLYTFMKARGTLPPRWDPKTDAANA
jgi:hypothetical protein